MLIYTGDRLITLYSLNSQSIFWFIEKCFVLFSCDSIYSFLILFVNEKWDKLQVKVKIDGYTY